MDKASIVKEEVLFFLKQNLGEVTTKTFHDFYADETLPIYLDAALDILGDLMGRDKARLQLNAILSKNAIKESI